MDEPDDKKKKKKNSNNPFDFNDDFFDQINKQLRKMFEHGEFPDFSDSTNPFAKMISDILKQMNINPADFAGMDPKEIQEILKEKLPNKSPFVFGFNMKQDPEGRPFVTPFGNVKPKRGGNTEIKPERDPLVDVYEEGDQVVVVIEIPGVKKEDIEIRASPNELEINAISSESNSYRYHKLIPLPTKINPDVAKARYQNGIMEIKLKKIGEEENKKKISID